MKSFDTWFENLCDNYVWFEPASLHHRPETFRKLAHKVYMQEVASGVFRPIQEARKHVYNIVCNTPGDAKKVDWAGKALEKLENSKGDWVPVPDEKAEQYRKQIKEILANSTLVNAFPRLTEEEKRKRGDWKPAPFEPRSDIQKAEIVLAHLEKVRNARAKLFRHHFPDASEEEVEAYVNKFSDL